MLPVHFFARRDGLIGQSVVLGGLHAVGAFQAFLLSAAASLVSGLRHRLMCGRVKKVSRLWDWAKWGAGQRPLPTCDFHAPQDNDGLPRTAEPQTACWLALCLGVGFRGGEGEPGGSTADLAVRPTRLPLGQRDLSSGGRAGSEEIGHANQRIRITEGARFGDRGAPVQ